MERCALKDQYEVRWELDITVCNYGTSNYFLVFLAMKASRFIVVLSTGPCFITIKHMIERILMISITFVICILSPDINSESDSHRDYWIIWYECSSYQHFEENMTIYVFSSTLTVSTVCITSNCWMPQLQFWQHKRSNATNVLHNFQCKTQFGYKCTAQVAAWSAVIVPWNINQYSSFVVGLRFVLHKLKFYKVEQRSAL